MTIKFKNLVVWFTDQLTHPKTLCDKKTWGVFSKYAHLRRSDLKSKPSHATKEKALKIAENMGKKHGGTFTVYKCLYCDGWHVSKEKEAPVTTPQPISHEEIHGLNKVLSLNIPDIAAVYGGVRGRTLSSVNLSFAWPIIRESGIRTIIDLREDGIHSRLIDLCERYGIP